ncbi:MAG: outer membrane lipid asymmetry maintenance protein MlaD [Syntrophobacteraceae bacterium]
MERRWLELGVGLFLLIGILCMSYLSFKLGDVGFFGSSDYTVYASFANVGGLTDKGSVNMAGVNIGQVAKIELKNGKALVTLRIQKGVELEEDSIASIKTMGLIGDKYVSISAGGSDEYIKPNGTIRDTQPPLDLESMLGKYVFGSVDKGEGKDKEQ